MAVDVPENYVSILKEMSAGTGIPYSIEAAQVYVESDFNADATSSSGAEGYVQFLPSTYNEYASQAGVAEGTEYNPADEEKVYVAYMKTLLNQYGGNVADALAAYNAGTANSSAGQSYASEIENLAGTGNVTVKSNAVTTSVDLPFPGGWADPLNWPSGILSSVGTEALKPFEELLDDIKVHAKDWAIRFGLIILGVIILYAGIRGFLTPASTSPNQMAVNTGQGAVNWMNAPANNTSSSKSAAKAATAAEVVE